MPVCGERDEREIHAVEHQLNRHEDGDDVALDQKSRHAAGKQNSAEHKIIRERDHQSTSLGPAARITGGAVGGLLASTTAPMMATRIKIEVISNGSRNS